MRIDDLIWPTVQPHRWKWMRRGTPIAGIIWHATRSGQRDFLPVTEYGATLNWFRSPNNVKYDQYGEPWYGGMSNYVIGGGRVCLAVPEEYAPRYSAGIHDFSAISIEVAQPLGDMPYDPRDIALCRELADDLAGRYGIPRRRLMHVQGDVIGEVGHEDTAQGKSQGKSDPGPLFWEAYLQEEDMADPRLDEVIAALGGIDAIRTWNSTGNSLLAGYALEQVKLGDHLAMPHPLAGGIPKHAHHTTITHSTTGDVVV